MWITKAHYPIKITRNEPRFFANKQFVLVRNPVDAIPSYINLFTTLSHSLQPKEPACKTHPEDWDSLVKVVTEVYKYYCEAEQHRVSKAVPTYFIRYEDLCTRPKETLKELFRYLLNVKDLTGTVIEKRINDLVDKGSNSSSVYKLKAGQDYSKLLRNENKYSKELMDHLKSELKEAIHFFGYAHDPESEDKNTETSFFKYDKESLTADDKDAYMGFRKNNEEVLAKCGTPENEDPAVKY